MGMMQLDETDRTMIGLLRADARTSVATLAEKLGEPAIIALHDTNGRWDLWAELRATSTAELSKALERVRLIKGIRHTETSILLKSYR